LDRYPVIRYGSPDGFTLDFVAKIGEMFTPHPIKPRSLERGCRGASKYVPQRKPRVLTRGAGFTFADLSYEVLDIEGHPIKVATPECLLRMKEGTLRPIDQNDAIFLREYIRRRG